MVEHLFRHPTVGAFDSVRGDPIFRPPHKRSFFTVPISLTKFTWLDVSVTRNEQRGAFTRKLLQHRLHQSFGPSRPSLLQQRCTATLAINPHLRNAGFVVSRQVTLLFRFFWLTALATMLLTAVTTPHHAHFPVSPFSLVTRAPATATFQPFPALSSNHLNNVP